MHDPTPVPASAPAAEIVYAEPAKPEDFAQQLAALNAPKAVGDAAGAAAWLDKCIPSSLIDGMRLPGFALLDPTKKKTYDDLVNNKDFAETKHLLASRLRLWNNLIGSTEDVDSVGERARQRLEKLEALLAKNLEKAYETIRPIETTYRSIDGFFMNAAVEPGDKVDVSFINASMEQLLNPNDRSVFEEGLSAAIQTRFRDFTLKETFSNLCIPGWARSVSNLDRLGTLGSQNKVQIFTDSDNYESFKQFQDTLDQRPFEGMRGAGLEKQYVSMFGNWLLGRKRHAFEHEDLWLPPSALMAGLIYKTDETIGIQESAAGYRKGKLQGCDGLRFKLDLDTAGKMINQYGTNPIVDFGGSPVAFGDANLSSKAGLDTYPRIRTEDWLIKNTCHYLNKQAYQNFTETFRSAVKSDLYEFMSSCKGPDSEIQGFDIQVISTPEQERRHEVDVVLTVTFQTSVRQFNVKVKETEGLMNAEVKTSSV